MSSATAAARSITVDIVSDTICPWCFVGKRRLEKAFRAVPELTYTVRWHPFQLDPSLPAIGVDKLARYEAKFGGKQNVAAMLARMAEVGKREGISFDYGGRISNTVDSHRLIEWAGARGLQDALVEQLFKFYFERRGDLGDRAALAREAAAVGLPEAEASALLASDEVRPCHVERQAHRSGRRHGSHTSPLALPAVPGSSVAKSSPRLQNGPEVTVSPASHSLSSTARPAFLERRKLRYLRSSSETWPTLNSRLAPTS